MQITHNLANAAAHMEGVCGDAPATKILKLEVTSYLWCLASRRTLIHWAIPWNRLSDHRLCVPLAEENTLASSQPHIRFWLHCTIEQWPQSIGGGTGVGGEGGGAVGAFAPQNLRHMGIASPHHCP